MFEYYVKVHVYCPKVGIDESLGYELRIINIQSYCLFLQEFPFKLHSNIPLDDPGKNKIRCTPRGTKVAIYHIVGIFQLGQFTSVS